MHQHKKYFLLLVLLTFMPIALIAQKKNYYPGYIITLEGDTLEGWIKDRSSGSFTKLYPPFAINAGILH